MLTLVLTFLGIFLSLASLTAKNLSEFTLIYEGCLPTSIDYKYFKPANLLGKEHEFIVVKHNFYFEVFQFTGEQWKSFYEIPFMEESSINAKITKSIAWTIGDLNNNGKDEIVICIDRTIKRFEWNGNQFKKTVYEFPYLTDDILIGDINNDNLNELVLLCYETSLSSEEPGCKYYLCNAKLNKKGLHLLWTDGGKLGYVKSNVIPSDHLVCIADMENTGSNQLIVAEGQSDVSPTRYNLLIWEKDELKLLKSFIVSKGTMITTGHIEAAPFLIDDLIPIKVKSQTMFIASMVYPHVKCKQVLLRIENNNLSIIDTIFDHSGWSFPNRVYWINIDGKGKGLLRVTKLRSGESKYVFYRF